MLRHKLFFFGVIFYFIIYTFAISTSLFAEETEDNTDSTAKQPDEIVVTATRTPTSLEKVGGSSVSVVSDEDIKSKKQQHIEEVLKDVPGIDVVSNGGPGTRTSIFIRGADTKNVLVLIDGVMFNDPSSAGRSADIGNLTVDNVERIEVVRGSQSVLYGSNATAGVINIITKKGTGKPVITAGAEAGSYGTSRLYVGTRGKTGALNYSINLSRTEIEGFSTANDRNEDIAHAGNTDEKDGWQNLNISASLGYTFSKDFDISLIMRNIISRVEYDDMGPGYAGDRFDGYPPVANPTGQKDRHKEQQQGFYTLKVHNFFMDGTLESNLSYNISSHLREMYDQDNEKTDTYQGDTTEMTWQGTLFLGNTQEITLGAGLFNESILKKDVSGGVSSTAIDKSASISSVWLQDRTTLMNDSLIIVIGARNDSHDTFGTATTWRVAPSYKISNTGTLLKMSSGTGFQSPSLFELYSSYGNEDLEASDSRTSDIGFEQHLDKGRHQFGLTLFTSEFDNRIMYEPATSKYGNVKGTTKTSGWEAFYSTRIGKSTQLSLDHVHTETEDPDGNPLVRRPKDKSVLKGKTTIDGKANISFSLYNVGTRDAYAGAKDKNGNTVDKLDAYVLLNLAGSYKIKDNMEIYGRIDNLSDTYYEECWSYATPGRSYYLGVKASFK